MQVLVRTLVDSPLVMDDPLFFANGPVRQHLVHSLKGRGHCLEQRVLCSNQQDALLAHILSDLLEDLLEVFPRVGVWLRRHPGPSALEARWHTELPNLAAV